VLRGIDHIVVVVPDLDVARLSYEALGFTVVPGGRHPIGTHNALVAFADGAYVELIAFYASNAEHRWWTALHQGGGFVDFCMQTDDLRGDTAAFRAAGVDIADPTPLSRARPDGYQIKWVLSIPRGAHRGVAPFLIEDETPRAERVPRRVMHANGVTGIGTVTVAVKDPESVRRWYEPVLKTTGRRVERTDVGGAGVRFVIGPHTLDFVAPAAPASPVAAWLAARAESPYAATLTTPTAAPGPLDEKRTLGARFSYVP
jgi:catechol 2,3-dioxygenase-like lactoylglutathione lyase family enzyme